MKIIIYYKNDGSTIPFCANTEINGKYFCAWSFTSYGDAKRRLLKQVQAFLHPKVVPESETVEVA